VAGIRPQSYALLVAHGARDARVPGLSGRGFSMQGLIAAGVGIVVGVAVLFFLARRPALKEGPTERVTALGWCALGLGVVALLAGALAMTNVPLLTHVRTSIGLAAAAVVVAVGAVVKRDRQWPSWVGLTAAVIAAVYWTVYMVRILAGIPR
jgi:hypothetical protein